MLKSIFSLTTLLTLLIFSIAGSAAYFSIYGLMLIFSGAPIAVAIMAGSLETGKLVFTSVLFNYWKRLNKMLTIYGVIAVFFLMVITSGGIYGFLSSAYQTSQVPLDQINIQIQSLDAEAKRSEDRVQELDRIIATIGSNYVSKRIEEKKQQASERNKLQKRIDEIYQQKLDLNSSKMQTEVHIGPIVKIAEALDLPKDKAVHYLILLFIIVFDPLAIALTLCLNAIIAIKKQDDEKSSQQDSVPDAIGNNPPSMPVQEIQSDNYRVLPEQSNNPPEVPKYDDSELIRRLDELANEMNGIKRTPEPTPPSKNDLRQKLINNTRTGEIDS
jgi:hypothetical protein